MDPEVDFIKGRQGAPRVTFCALVGRKQEPLVSHCTTLRGEARTTNIMIHDWQHDRKRCDADVQDEVVIMSSVLMFSLQKKTHPHIYIYVYLILYVATWMIRGFFIDRKFTLIVTSS